MSKQFIVRSTPVAPARLHNFIVRPTNMAAAFVDAAVKSMKVDHKPDGTAKNWVAKRVVNNCDKDGCGVVREPAFNAHLSYKTAKALGLAG